ncbi:hypothetical protein J7T55_005272 [Diaporthe amygdali]|uniref:uncharacterized protein n=1 Tax=Phomopsis amygdali TaxID=1214568 RepID=UPI0022FE2386|nr:uncharacterized protein J7T55_005272 [Diaporthe amygdali]KAJ0108295.1 hypothetical protein J7T55_005272 [Diaporthe amygdali]
MYDQITLNAMFHAVPACGTAFVALPAQPGSEDSGPFAFFAYGFSTAVGKRLASKIFLPRKYPNERGDYLTRLERRLPTNPSRFKSQPQALATKLHAQLDIRDSTTEYDTDFYVEKYLLTSLGFLRDMIFDIIPMRPQVASSFST